MPTYVAFLRAINLGAKRKYPMAELRQVLEDAGYDEVATHINTGNVRVRAGTRSAAKLQVDLERLLTEDRGFTVQVVVLTTAELSALAAEVDRIADQHSAAGAHYVSLLQDEPTAQLRTAMQERGVEDETVVASGRAVHLLYDKPYHQARNTNATVEKHLGVATNRNATVIRAVAGKWGT